MSGFIEWLEKLNEKDTKVRAVLRRSLAFDPGTFPTAYPYVEPFVKNEEYSWRREMFYLIAGLWASHWRKDQSGESVSLGKACANYRDTKSESIERRFITLLDADPDELPYRLRQMVALLKDYNIDFRALLKDLLRWNNDRKLTQNQWARDFYQKFNTENETENTLQLEETE
jgi:CRISPR system Cascade subunit CasB